MAKFDLAPILASVVKKFPRVARMVRRVALAANPEIVLVLDYPVTPKRRWTLGSPHPELYRILEEGRDGYRATLEGFLSFRDPMSTIPMFSPDGSSTSPWWGNGWIPPLDGAAIYGFIATRRPKIYMEVGSGNSTKFARKAIADLGLDTRIISIDPQPRAEIDDICDEVVRAPVEDVDLSLFDQLGENDILFVDNSHRAFMNSDVTAVFVDILPRLKPGVIVQIHDILLPYDYPQEWLERWYSEQYLVAVMLLSKGTAFKVLLPNMFISEDAELRKILDPVWEPRSMRDGDIFGYSFWLRAGQPSGAGECLPVTPAQRPAVA